MKNKGMLRCATPNGVLSACQMRLAVKMLEDVMAKDVQMESVLQDRQDGNLQKISPRTASAKQTHFGGHGVKDKCGCRGKCDTLRCPCKKGGSECNSRCHNGSAQCTNQCL